MTDHHALRSLLLVEQKEEESILPPAAGVPDSLRRFVSDGRLVQSISRRKHYFLDEWTHMNLVRASRPFAAPKEEGREDTVCRFCPGGEGHVPRDAASGGPRLEWGNPWTLRVFPNLFPWLLDHQNIVHTRSHKVSLAECSWDEERAGLRAAQELVREHERRGFYSVIFRNQGGGASLPHFHWQSGALSRPPVRVEAERAAAEGFVGTHGINLFDAILELERSERERWIVENEHWAAFAPYAPRTNFEVWLVARDEVSSLAALDEEQLDAMAQAWYRLLTAIHERTGLDSVFIICHQLPNTPEYRMHWEFMPVKPWSGAERGFYEFVVEVSPEKTAEILRDGEPAGRESAGRKEEP